MLAELCRSSYSFHTTTTTIKPISVVPRKGYPSRYYRDNSNQKAREHDLCPRITKCHSSSLNLTSFVAITTIITNNDKNRARVASAWQDRVRKAEEDYLAAAATTTAATSQPQAVGVKSKLQGRRGPSRGAVSAVRGAASRRKLATGGRGGHADVHHSDGGGDGDADALACIGKNIFF